jgi:hypothetical protein
VQTRCLEGADIAFFFLGPNHAMNILRGAPEAKKGSPSIKLKRRRAGMDLNYLKQIIKKAVTPDNSGI